MPVPSLSQRSNNLTKHNLACHLHVRRESDAVYGTALPKASISAHPQPRMRWSRGVLECKVHSWLLSCDFDVHLPGDRPDRVPFGGTCDGKGGDIIGPGVSLSHRLLPRAVPTGYRTTKTHPAQLPYPDTRTLDMGPGSIGRLEADLAAPSIKSRQPGVHGIGTARNFLRRGTVYS